MKRATYVERVAEVFRSRPGEWIDGMELASSSGCYAWRTRVSDARLQLGMRIDNRLRKVGERTVSEYRYCPPVGQMEMFQ